MSLISWDPNVSYLLGSKCLLSPGIPMSLISWDHLSSTFHQRSFLRLALTRSSIFFYNEPISSLLSLPSYCKLANSRVFNLLQPLMAGFSLSLSYVTDLLFYFPLTDISKYSTCIYRWPAYVSWLSYSQSSIHFGPTTGRLLPSFSNCAVQVHADAAAGAVRPGTGGAAQHLHLRGLPRQDAPQPPGGRGGLLLGLRRALPHAGRNMQQLQAPQLGLLLHAFPSLPAARLQVGLTFNTFNTILRG